MTTIVGEFFIKGGHIAMRVAGTDTWRVSWLAALGSDTVRMSFVADCPNRPFAEGLIDQLNEEHPAQALPWAPAAVSRVRINAAPRGWDRVGTSHD